MPVGVQADIEIINLELLREYKEAKKVILDVRVIASFLANNRTVRRIFCIPSAGTCKKTAEGCPFVPRYAHIVHFR